MLDAELAEDEAVFVRRGGGAGGGTLARKDCTDPCWVAFPHGSVLLRETDPTGTRSIRESVLAVGRRRGGSGGAGLREIGPCDTPRPLDAKVSNIFAGPADVRSDDGFDGFGGGVRSLAGIFASGCDDLKSFSSHRSIKLPSSTSGVPLPPAIIGASSWARRGGNKGLLAT